MNLSVGLRLDAKPPVAQLCFALWNGVTIDHLQGDLKPARRTTEPPPRSVPDLVADVRRFATETHRRLDQRCEYINQAYQGPLSAVEQGRR